MSEYRALEKLARFLAFFILIAFVGSLIHLSVVQEARLFKIDSPLIYPALVCLVLLFCLVWDWIIDYRKNRQQKSAGATAEIRYEYKIVSAVFSCLLVYVLVMKYVTLPFAIFPLATIIFTVIVTVLINDGPDSLLVKTAKALLVSALLVSVIYYSFFVIFRVLLP